MTIVAMDRFGNSHTAEEAANNLLRFRELLPQIEAVVAHDPNKLYLGGISGGALRAIAWANKIDRPWQGIFWCGGWLGHDKNLLDSDRVEELSTLDDLQPIPVPD